MRKRRVYWTLFIAALAWLASCSDDGVSGSSRFNPNQPIEITEFYPDSGGIATPIVIGGRSFGTDATGMKVYFGDVDEVRHPAGLVSSNGSRIYTFIPKGLTFRREINILIGRRTSDGQECVSKAPDQFLYKAQTSTNMVARLTSPDNNINAVGGDLTTCTFSSPFYLCIDGEDNIFVIGHKRDNGKDKQPSTACRNEEGEGISGGISVISVANDSSITLKYGTAYINTPAYSDEKDAGAVYIPDDADMKYYDMQKLLNYVPRYRTALKSEKLNTVNENNWKHCFVVNKLDHMIYTVMWKGQLVRVNPKNRIAEILLKEISSVATGDDDRTGSDSYIAFSPIKGEEDVLYVSLANFHQIWRVDVSKITPEDEGTYDGESYIGRTVHEGIMNERGWEDDLLKDTKSRHPRQICFIDDGKMYITDSGNSCVRVIDTTMPKERAAVTTPIGLLGAEGYKDGGPEIAEFHSPCGVAVNNDGTIVYVTDTQNKVVRKLSIG